MLNAPAAESWKDRRQDNDRSIERERYVERDDYPQRSVQYQRRGVQVQINSNGAGGGECLALFRTVTRDQCDRSADQLGTVVRRRPRGHVVETRTTETEAVPVVQPGELLRRMCSVKVWAH